MPQNKSNKSYYDKHYKFINNIATSTSATKYKNNHHWDLFSAETRLCDHFAKTSQHKQLRGTSAPDLNLWYCMSYILILHFYNAVLRHEDICFRKHDDAGNNNDYLDNKIIVL